MPACGSFAVSSRSRRLRGVSRSQFLSTYSASSPLIVGQLFIRNYLACHRGRAGAPASRADRRLPMETNPTDIATFVDRYVNIWNEPDPEQRRRTIRELWQ